MTKYQRRRFVVESVFTRPTDTAPTGWDVRDRFTGLIVAEHRAGRHDPTTLNETQRRAHADADGRERARP